jgi:hypothetical protein
MPATRHPAITVKQPFASLINRGIKKLETRVKPTSYRGELYLHSAITPHHLAPGLAKNEEALPYLSGLTPQNSTTGGFNAVAYEALPLGVILGRIRIIDCLPAWEMLQKWREEKGESPAAIEWEREYQLGDLGTDMYAYEIEVVTVFTVLLPARGQLGIYDLEKLNPGISAKLPLLY